MKMCFLTVCFVVKVAVITALPLYYCNSSYLTPFGSGMFDGMYLFDSIQVYTFVQARNACKNWALPAQYRNVSFVPGDIMNTNPSLIQPDLASLWDIDNFNSWFNIALSLPQDYWLGVAQNFDATLCGNTALPGVFEPSFNWTWADGTPLLRDTKGSGLVFFQLTEPNNYASSNHYGSYLSSLQRFCDETCQTGYRAACSIPRKLLFCIFWNVLNFS
jgi:hypothetical protein